LEGETYWRDITARKVRHIGEILLLGGWHILERYYCLEGETYLRDITAWKVRYIWEILLLGLWGILERYYC
jgi:hypothetical protein